MAITWGAWHLTGGNGMRVGVDVTNTTVTSGSSSVTFTVKYYTENQYNYLDPQVLNRTGHITGSLAYTNNSVTGSGAVLRDTRTHSYTYSTYGSSPGTRTFGAYITGTYNGSAPTVSKTVSIPARPYAAPPAPTGLSASRTDDTEAAVSWSLSGDVSSIDLQMSTYSGSTWSSFVNVYNPSSAATSYNKTGLQSNRVYTFQVRAENSSGASSWTQSSAYAYMTPAQPSAVAVTMSGDQFQVDWTDAAYVSGYNYFIVERQVDGGAWTVLTSSISQRYDPHSFVDDTQPVGTIVYRVSIKNTAYATLTSAATSASPVYTTPPVPPDPSTRPHVTAVFDGYRWRPTSVQVAEDQPISPDEDPVADGQVWFVVNTGTNTVTGMLVSYGGTWNTVPI